jgi:hypothetical protein
MPVRPNFSLDGYFAETKTVYEFNGCYWHGHSCQPFRDTPTAAGDTLAERYERTITRLAKITKAGYLVEVHWECEFDKGILATPLNWRHEPFNTREVLYGGRTEAMRLHYKAAEGETIQYVDVMSLYKISDTDESASSP